MIDRGKDGDLHKIEKYIRFSKQTHAKIVATSTTYTGLSLTDSMFYEYLIIGLVSY